MTFTGIDNPLDGTENERWELILIRSQGIGTKQLDLLCVVVIHQYLHVFQHETYVFGSKWDFGVTVISNFPRGLSPICVSDYDDGGVLALL